jgi:hypothetical protein
VVIEILSLSKKFFIPPDLDHVFEPKFAPFVGAIGALDGSHIPAVVSPEEQSTFRNRKQAITQNLLAVSNFDLTFSYALGGWEGSAHDGQVLADAISNGFSATAPPGKYYLADAGYALSWLCLVPYRGVRYHLKEWRLGNEAPQNREELFNLRHSSLRNVVERIFGVIKKRFPILVNMPSYDFLFQVDLFLCALMVHNFIRMEQEFEDEFDRWNTEDMEDEDIAEADVEVQGNAAQVGNLNEWRNGIAQQLWDDYQNVLNNM